jgi:large subunit ribosomal protein L29
MRKRDLQDMAPEELQHKERELREEIFHLKMKRTASTLDNKMLLRNRRRDLARVITYLRTKTEGKAN